jgi:outer membrane protein OmpA-like peptidoglycan-associated protein
MTSKPYVVALALAVAALGTTGCATKKYVKTETGAVNTRVDEVQGEVEQAQTRLNTHESKLGQHDQQLGQQQQQIGDLSKTAQEALDRAQQAGQLAQGKFLYETVLTDEKVKFGFDTADLSPEAQAAVDEFAAKIKEQNQNVYIEIQGHTDNVGDRGMNQRLSEARARAVKDALEKRHVDRGRLDTHGYGELHPIAPNKSPGGRQQNRRVDFVILDRRS